MFESGKMYLVIRNRKKTIGIFFIPGSFFFKICFFRFKERGTLQEQNVIFRTNYITYVIHLDSLEPRSAGAP